MMRDEDLRKYIDTYVTSTRAKYESFSQELYRYLETAIRSITPHAILQTRVKSPASFAEKLYQKRSKYSNPLYEVTDLCGVRIIAHTLAEVERVSEAIRAMFNIRHEDSYDAFRVLAPSQFGYRSVHYVVEGLQSVDVSYPLLSDNSLKAEIQIRTIAQHCWADIGHDSVYKSRIPLSDQRKREFTLIAALLEDVDEALGRAMRGISSIRGSGEQYLSSRQLKETQRRLELVGDFAGDDALALSLRRARIAIRLGDWQKVLDTCASLTVNPDQSPDLLVCRAFAKWQISDLDGAIADTDIAIKLDNKLIDALLLKGHILRRRNKKAIDSYGAAYRVSPSDPRALSAYAIELAAERRNTEFAGLARHAISQAIQMCREQADMGVDVPSVYFTMGELHLLMAASETEKKAFVCEVTRCMCSYAKGLAWHPTKHDISLARDAADRLEGAISGDVLEAVRWIKRLLAVGESFRFGTSLPDLTADTRDWDINARVVLIPTENSDSSQRIFFENHHASIESALNDLNGALVIDPVVHGIIQFAAKLKRTNQRLAIWFYWPERAQTDPPHDFNRINVLSESAHTAFMVVATWQHLLQHGIAPESVRLLAFGGSSTAAFAYRLALALGAEVGVVHGSGGAGDELLSDPDWKDCDNLTPLAHDGPETWKAFVTGPFNQLSCLIEKTSTHSALEAVCDQRSMRDNCKVTFIPQKLEKLDHTTNEILLERQGKYDVVLHYSYKLARYVKNQMVYTVDEMKDLVPNESFEFEDDLQRDEAFDRWQQSSFYRVGGNRRAEPIGYPCVFNTMLLVYNRRLIGNDPPQTWEELENMARVVTQPATGKSGIVLQGSSEGDWQYYEWCNFAFGHGGGVIRKQYDWEEWEDNAADLLVDANTVLGTERYRRLLESTPSPSDYRKIGHSEQQEAMLTGNVGMAIMWSDRLAEFCNRAKKTKQLDDFGFSAVPGKHAMNGTGTLFVYKPLEARRARQAVRFVARIMNKSTQQQMMQFGLCPVFEDLYDTQEAQVFPFFEAVKQSLKKSTSMLEASRAGTSIRKEIQRSLTHAMDPRADVREVLDTLRKNIIQLRRRFNANF